MKKITIIILSIITIHFSNAQTKTTPLNIGDILNVYSKYNDTNYEVAVCLPKNYDISNNFQSQNRPRLLWTELVGLTFFQNW